MPTQTELNEQLIWALSKDFSRIDEEVVKKLIENGASANSVNPNGVSALYYALRMNHMKVLKILLNAGADVNRMHHDGYTSLHYALQLGCSHPTKDWKAVTELLLKKGANLNTRVKHTYYHESITLLHAAAIIGDVNAERVKFLLDRGIDVNAVDIDGETPLHHAVEAGQMEVVKALLAAGANFLLKTNYSPTPIYLAKNDAIKQLLADAEKEIKKEIIGASKISLHEFLLTDLTNTTDLIRYVHNSQLLQGLKQYRENNPKFAKMTKAQCEIIKERIYREKEASNAMVRMYALNKWELSEDASRILIANLPNVTLENLISAVKKINVKGKGGKTSLHWAAEDGHINAVKNLLKIGADINISDDNQRTPLHIAAQEGNADIVQLLIIRGADTSTKDKEGRTPLDIAREKGYTTIANLLTNSTQVDDPQVVQQAGESKSM